MTKETQEQGKERNGSRYKELIKDAEIIRETPREDFHLNFRNALFRDLQEIARRAYTNTTPKDLDSHLQDLCTLRYSYILADQHLNPNYQELLTVFQEVGILLRDRLDIARTQEMRESLRKLVTRERR